MAAEKDTDIFECSLACLAQLRKITNIRQLVLEEIARDAVNEDESFDTGKTPI